MFAGKNQVYDLLRSRQAPDMRSFYFCHKNFDLSLPVATYAQFTPIEASEYAAIIVNNKGPRKLYSQILDLCVKIESENKVLFQLHPDYAQVAGQNIVITLIFEASSRPALKR